VLISPVFLAGSAVVILAPGPDLALATRLVITRGRRDALTAAGGMVTAGAAQAAAGFAGLSLLFRTSPTAFAVFRFAGATALLVLGLTAIAAAVRPPRPADPAADASPGAAGRAARRSWWQGLACTGTNPKVGIFLTAYLPQFVPTGASPASSIPVLAAVYLGMGALWLIVWILLIHRLSRVLLGPRVVRATDLLAGAVLVTFGTVLAIGLR
jgi:threonine/homoserine/homoserine lactone efflux protein